MVPLQKKKGYDSRMIGMVPVHQKKAQLTGDRYDNLAKKGCNSRMTGMVPVQPKKGYNLRVTGKLLMQKKGHNSQVTGMVLVQQKKV